MPNNLNLKNNQIAAPVNLSLLQRITTWLSSSSSHELVDAKSDEFEKGRHIGVDLKQFEIDKWTDLRVQILEIIWGRGNRLPGDGEFHTELFFHHDLSSKTKALDVAVGLGACATMIAQENFTHVDVVESYPELLPYLIQRIKDKKLSPFISILKNNLNDVKLDRAKYDLVYGREAFFKIKNKQLILQKCINSLQTNGQLIFTDFVLAQDASDQKIFKNWSAREKETVYPVSIKHYEKLFNGFDVQLMPPVDYSKQYIEYVNAGWERLKQYLETHPVDQEFVNIMAQESDLWLSRVRALRSGKLKFVKFHAIL
ncbi:MAG: methyltransferase domain-containing protein [Rhizobiales bacterium]|nr:methyltransferase domain-containing protein [Hyphomicrobiales bacterium]NRB13150.1 methyltransferase domain-containing protein [Hyphomicrobiales bacterium]